jgi:hypothetical protein
MVMIYINPFLKVLLVRFIDHQQIMVESFLNQIYLLILIFQQKDVVHQLILEHLHLQASHTLLQEFVK